MRHVLIVANLTLAGEQLWEAVQERLDLGPCRFSVLVPASHPPFSGTWTAEEMRQEAAERLERALTRLHELGAHADGRVGDSRVIDATFDAIRETRYDEIIVSTLPPGVSRWLKLDVISRLRRVATVPVTHVVGELERV